MREPWATVVAAVVLVGAAVFCTPARADWIYTYVGMPTYASAYPAPDTRIVLDITDAAMRSGRFDLSGTGLYDGPGSPPPSYGGDATGLVSFSATGMATATPSYFPSWNTFSLAFVFDGAGNITADTITFHGPSDDGHLKGNQALTSGAVGSDGPWCNADETSGRCTVSGSWTAVDPPGAPVAIVSGAQTSLASSAVPEPASFALLGAGLIGLATRKGLAARKRDPA